MGNNPVNPHQLLNHTPKIPISKPNIILDNLSIKPTFRFILLKFESRYKNQDRGEKMNPSFTIILLPVKIPLS